MGYNYLLTIAQVFDGGFPPWRRAPTNRIIKTMNTSHTTNTHKPTRTALENLRGVYKGLLIVALICAAGYIAAFGMITNHQEGFDGLFVAAGFGIVFIISAVIALIAFCVAAFNYHRLAWAVLIATPLIVIGLPILIAMGYGNFVWKDPRPTAQERQQEKARREAAARAYIAQQTTPVNTPRPAFDFSDQGITINQMNLPQVYQRPITGLSFKTNNNFGNTLVGNKQTLLRLSNIYTKQKVIIEAIYSETCAAHWRKDNDGSDLHQLTREVGNLINSEVPIQDQFKCVGLLLAVPLKIGDVYIGIETTSEGGPVELAELPQLVNVIQNAQPK